jgi:hypothetical protein
MPRPKGSENKITTEVKEQLQSLIDKVVNSIAVNSMELSQFYHLNDGNYIGGLTITLGIQPTSLLILLIFIYYLSPINIGICITSNIFINLYLWCTY